MNMSYIYMICNAFVMDTQRFKHIFTILTHISFPASQTTSVTVTCDFVAYPRISTSQAAILRTIISKQADTTLYQMKFTIAVSSRVDKKINVYLMRIASNHTVFIFILKNTFITYVYVWHYALNIFLIFWYIQLIHF